MLNRRAAKKLKMNNQDQVQEGSLSSSGTNRKDKVNKITDGKGYKKRNLKEPKAEARGQVQVEAEKSINDLPPEMLMKILSNVDTKSLVQGRRVNRNFNVIARELLQSRNDLQIQFYMPRYNSSSFYRSAMMHKHQSLQKFINFFGQSQNTVCLYSHFSFLETSPSSFNDKEWIDFISAFGERIKGLKLVFKNEFDMLKKSVPSLRHLLLDQLPNLTELCLDTRRDLGWCKELRLFPASENSDSNPGTSKSKSAQLPHLKILRLDGSSMEKHREIVLDILRASVNLQKLHFLGYGRVRRFYAMELKLLESLGKIHCLEAAEICLDWEFLPKIQGNFDVSRNYKLKELSLSFGDGCYGDNQSDASIYLSNLFESSKNTLTKLTTRPFGHFPQIQFPTFNKLTSLRINSNASYQTLVPILSIHSTQQIQFANIFPALKCLDLNISWTDAFTEGQTISSMPTLETLQVLGQSYSPFHRFREIPIQEISGMCPNLKHFKISDGKERLLKNFPQVGLAIWTHMKKLESLEVSLDVDSRDNKFPAIDSCITGIAGEDCIRLYDSAGADKLAILRKGKTQGKISQADLEVEKQNISILDLKDLKNLRISLFSETGSSSKLINGAITFLSKKHAFKLMDNFTYKIKRESLDLDSSDW